MTITREFLQNIRESEQPFLRQAIELAKHFSETRKRVADEGGDWSALKAILKAEILDEEGGEHLAAILSRADESAQYAGMLGLHINKKSFSSRVSSVRPGPAGHTPMRAGRDDKAGLKKETDTPAANARAAGNDITEPAGASSGEAAVLQYPLSDRRVAPDTGAPAASTTPDPLPSTPPRSDGNGATPCVRISPSSNDDNPNAIGVATITNDPHNCIPDFLARA